MKWNENDTKYIFKRLILYLIITGIVFFAGSKCAKAQIQSGFLQQYTNGTPTFITITGISSTFRPYTSLSSGTHTTLFQNYGEGYVLFNLLVGPATSSANAVISGITIHSTGNDLFACDIGNMQTYVDNSKYNNNYSVKCPVKFTNGSALYSIEVYRSGTTGQTAYWPSDLITFVSEQQADYSTITSAQQQTSQQIQNVYNQMMNEGTYTRNAINNAATQAHSDSQAEQQAINNNTQAINDLNSTINADFNFDTGFLDGLDLFQPDEDILRRILMLPYNIALMFGTVFGSPPEACVPYNFGSLLGTNLVLPCINWKNYVGNTIYTLIDTIFGSCLLIGFITYCRKLVEFFLQIGAKGMEAVNVEVFR